MAYGTFDKGQDSEELPDWVIPPVATLFLRFMDAMWKISILNSVTQKNVFFFNWDVKQAIFFLDGVSSSGSYGDCWVTSFLNNISFYMHYCSQQVPASFISNLHFSPYVLWFAFGSRERCPACLKACLIPFIRVIRWIVERDPLKVRCILSSSELHSPTNTR